MAGLNDHDTMISTHDSADDRELLSQVTIPTKPEGPSGVAMALDP